MEMLVWGLFLMIHNPERCTTSDAPENGCEIFASLNVTYSDKKECGATASKLTQMDTRDKTLGVAYGSDVHYVCVLQPKPDQ